MKKLVFGFGLAFSIIFGLAGCGSESESSSSKASESDSSFRAEDAIKIEDVDWSIYNGLVDGERSLLFSYVNNTEYTIYRVEIEFTPKAGTTADDFSALLAFATDEDIAEFTESFDTYISYITMDSTNYQVTPPGESANNGSECDLGYFEVQTSDQCAFMEPDIITVSFIGPNGLGYKTSYDFKYQTYTTSPRDGIVLQPWPDSEISGLLPETNFDIIEISSDQYDWFTFYAYGVSRAEYDAYVKAIKNTGFTYDYLSHDDSYSADNKDGINVYVSYEEVDHQLYVRIYDDGTTEEIESSMQIVESDIQSKEHDMDASEIRPEFQEVVDATMDVTELLKKIFDVQNQIYDIENQYGSVDAWYNDYFAKLGELTPESADEAQYIYDVCTHIFSVFYDAGVFSEDELNELADQAYAKYVEPFE
ncbi:MAG: hypothetical protein LUC06_00370 [Oscillospiraceae bacterium]|nr:hypothetical protein [Oscillospiraceae bacterium]